MRKIDKVWVVSLLTVLAIAVLGINVYPKVVIDNIVEVEKLYRSDVLEDSFPAYVKSESDPEDGWVLLGYMTINCEGDHSYFGPLNEGEYKVEAWAGAINHWTDEPRAGWTWYPWPHDYLSVNGHRFKIGPWFWTQAEAEAYWKGDYIILDIPQGGYIDGYWRDPDYSDNAGSCTVAIYGRGVVDYIKVFPDPAYVLVEKELQFVVKGYGFGENGERDGDPDPETYAPAGDDTGPEDIEATWTTTVPENVGTIDENTGLFQSGQQVGEGKVKATYIISEGEELTDEVDVAVLDIEYFLIRDARNYWNLIKHIPADNKYWDHQQKVSGELAQVVVAADSQTDSAQVRLEIATNPAGLEDKIMWQAESEQVDPQTGNFDANGRAWVTISSAGTGQETYQIYVGVDSNCDEVLDLGKEVKSVNTIRLLTNAHIKDDCYDYMVAGTSGYDIIGYNVASTFAWIFLGDPDEADIKSTTEQSEVYRTVVYHPVGAPFSPSTGNAPIDRRVFEKNSEAADKIEESGSLQKLIEADLAGHKDKMLEHFAQSKEPYPIKHSSSKIEFSEAAGDGIDLAIGFLHCYISYDLEVKARIGADGQLKIKKLTVSNGEVTDRYQWNFYDGGKHEKMAVIQFAWVSPPQSGAGMIFDILVNFETKFKNFPSP